MTILVLHHRRPRIIIGSGNDQLAQLMKIGRCDGLRESQLSSKNGGDTDLVRLDVDIWGDHRTGSIVDTFPLPLALSMDYSNKSEILTIICLRTRPSFFSRICLIPAGGSLPF